MRTKSWEKAEWGRRELTGESKKCLGEAGLIQEENRK